MSMTALPSTEPGEPGTFRALAPQTPRAADHWAIWLIGLTLAVMGTGMAYSLLWPPVVRHKHWYWLTPGDLWSTVRAAHYVGWGGLAYVYTYHSALVTLPGYAILLAPVAALGSALHLTEIAPNLPGVPKPTMWLLVGPVTLATSAAALFAVDSLARRLRTGKAFRRVLSVVTAAAVWPAIAMWGHPEDVMALALAVWALIRAVDGHETSAGYLLGAALVMQLYAIILVPLFIGLFGIRKAPSVLFRAAVTPAFVAVFVLFPHFHQASQVLIEQPSFPTVDWATPWVALSPHLAKGIVAAGPSRLGAFVVAIGCGVAASRRRHDFPIVVWLAAACLASRCLFEAVMVPYYVMPGVVLALVAATSAARWRWMLAAAVGAGVTVQTFFHQGSWAFFSEMSALLIAMLVVAWPGSYRGLAPGYRMISMRRPWLSHSGSSGSLSTARDTIRLAVHRQAVASRRWALETLGSRASRIRSTPGIRGTTRARRSSLPASECLG